MNKYIDAEKLKSIIKAQIKERDEWMKDIDKSDRQEQLWSDLNGEDMSIIQTINSLQQEQPEVGLKKEIENYLATECAGDDEPSISEIARHFYELGLKARKEE